jgi:hypothetical protein
MKNLKVVGIGFLVIVVLLGMTWVFQGNDFFMYKFFGLKYENTRREIFEQSKAYNQGMQQDIQSMQFNYAQANKEQKEALADIILHRVADYDLYKLQPDTRAFVEQLKRERMGN